MLILIKPVHFMAWVQVLFFVTFACFWVRVYSDTQASNSSSSCLILLCPGFTSMCHHSFKHNAVKNICSWHVYVCTWGACHILSSSSSLFLGRLRHKLPVFLNLWNTNLIFTSPAEGKGNYVNLYFASLLLMLKIYYFI